MYDEQDKPTKSFDDIDREIRGAKPTPVPKLAKPVRSFDDIDNEVRGQSSAPTPFTGGRRVSPRDAAKYPIPVNAPSLAGNPSAKQSPVGYIGEPSVSDPNSPVGIQKEPWWGTDTDASGKETGTGMSINKPVGVAPKPRVVDPRSRQAAQVVRKINEQRNEATQLFQQADKTPGFAVDGGLNPGQQLRAQAEGKLEQANMLAKNAQQSHGDLVEIGFGKDTDPNSKRQWAYAKPKALKAKEEADAMAIRARDVERHADPRIQRQLLDQRTPMQKAASPGMKSQPVDTSNDPDVNWAQDKVARFGRSAAGLIPGAVSGLAQTADALYGGLNRMTGNRLPTEGISSDWSPVVTPAVNTLQQGINQSLPVDLARNEDFSSKIASGLGSAVGFGAAGKTLQAIGAPFKIGVGLSGVGAGADEIANEMKQAGFDRNVDPARYDRAVLLGGATGLSELVGLGKTLERFGLKRAAIQRGLEVLENSGQEAFQQWMGNVNAAKVGAYDKNRAQSQGVLESAILGGVISGGVQAADVGAQRMQPASIPDQIAQRTLANQNNAIRSESAPMQGIRPTTLGPTQITPLTRATAADPPATTTPAIEPTVTTPITPEPSANPPVAAESQPSAFPRLPEPEGFNARRAKLLGIGVPAEVGINERLQQADKLANSPNENDQKLGKRMLKQTLADIQKSEGYQGEIGLPDDAPKPYTAARAAIEERLKPAPKQVETEPVAPDAANSPTAELPTPQPANTGQRLIEQTRQKADTAIGEGRYGDAILELKAHQQALKDAKTAARKSPGLRVQLERQIGQVGNRIGEVRKMDREARKQASATTKPATFPQTEAPQVQSTQPITRDKNADISAPLLRPEAVQNPEGGIPEMPEQTFSGRLDQGIRKQDVQKPSAPAKRLKDEEADYYAQQEEAASEPTKSFDQIDEEIRGRRRPPAPARPQIVGNRPMTIDVAGTRTPSAMSAEFPRARREMVRAGREVEARLEMGQEKGQYGNFANAMFKSNSPDVLHGQDSFFHDPDVKGKLGLTRDAEMGDVRKELKTQLARSLGVTVDEVSLSHIKPEVWRAWARQKGLGKTAMRKLEAGINRAEGKERAIKTNAQTVAEESRRGKEELRQPEGKAPEDARLRAAIRDVTPEGYGPGEGTDESRREYDYSQTTTADEQKIKNSIREGEMLLKGKVSPERRAQIERSIESSKAKLATLQGETDAQFGKRTPAKGASEIDHVIPDRKIKNSDRAYDDPGTGDMFYRGDSVAWQSDGKTVSGTVTKVLGQYVTAETADGQTITRDKSKFTAAPRIAERRTVAPFTDRYTVKDLAKNATAEYRLARNRPGTVYLNDWGHALLADTLVQVYGEKIAGISGDFTVSAENARTIAEALNDRASGEFAPIAKALETAAADADANGRDVAIVTKRAGQPISRVKTAVRHETTHTGQSAIDKQLTGAATENWLARQPKAKQIKEELTRRGYPESTHGYEAVAFVASGEYDAFGLTLNEATGLLDSYYRATVRKYGASALEKFGAIDPKLQPTLERARDEAGIRRTDTERSTENTRRNDRGSTIRARQEERDDIGGNESATQERQGRAAEVPAVSRKTREDVENSPAFKRWFGDSKVVTRYGDPQIVYHGAEVAEPFDTFNLDLIGSAYQGAGGFWFTSSPFEAAKYAGVEPIELSRRDYNLSDDPTETQDFPYDIWKEKWGDNATGRIFAGYLSIKKPLVINGAKISRGYEETNELVEKARKSGNYDGVIIENAPIDGVSNGGTYYVAFSPSQIKSATGNRGTFDTASLKISERKEKRASFGELENEPRGQVLASGFNIQDLFSRKSKDTKPERQMQLPKDWKIDDWAKKTYADAMVNALSPKDRAEYDKATTEREKQVFLLSAVVDGKIEAKVFELIDKASEAAAKGDNRAVMEAVRDAREYAGAPATNLEKLSALRKASMLLRPVTHARNLLGNTVFQPLEEAARVPGSIADSAMGLITGRRTLKGANPAEMMRSTAHAATEGVQQAKDAMRGLDPEDLEKAFQVKEIKFKNRIIDKAVKFSFRSLNAEDKIFYTYAYDRALREQAKLTALNERKNGIVDRKDQKARAEYLHSNPTVEMDVDATTAAEVAVFRNKNILSTGIQSARTAMGDKGAFAVDLILPFDKTPTNIIARTLEYTPLGGVIAAGKAAAFGGRTVKEYRAARKEGTPSKQAIKGAIDKAMTPAQQRSFSLLVGRSVTGTVAPIALGYFLAAAGMATGAYDEDDRKENAKRRETNTPPSSIKIGGRWYQIGGLPPLGSLVAMGATLHEEVNKEGSDAESIILGTAKGVGQIASDVPLLRSTKDAVEGLTKEGRAGQKVGRIASSFIPSVVSDAGQITPGLRDEYERQTRSDKKVKGFAKFGRDVAGEVAGKIPGLRKLLPIKTDGSGRKIETELSDPFDPFSSRPALNSADLPGFKGERSRIGLSNTELKQKTGEPNAIYQQRVDRVNGWMETYGQKLIDHPRYKSLSADEQKAAVESLHRRIGAQQNNVMPNVRGLEPGAVLLGVKRSAAGKAKRDRGRLWVAPPR